MIEERNKVSIVILGSFSSLSKVELCLQVLNSFYCSKVVEEAENVLGKPILIEVRLSEHPV